MLSSPVNRWRRLSFPIRSLPLENMLSSIANHWIKFTFNLKSHRKWMILHSLNVLQIWWSITRLEPNQTGAPCGMNFLPLHGILLSNIWYKLREEITQRFTPLDNWPVPSPQNKAGGELRTLIRGICLFVFTSPLIPPYKHYRIRRFLSLISLGTFPPVRQYSCNTHVEYTTAKHPWEVNSSHGYSVVFILF